MMPGLHLTTRSPNAHANPIERVWNRRGDVADCGTERPPIPMPSASEWSSRWDDLGRGSLIVAQDSGRRPVDLAFGVDHHAVFVTCHVGCDEPEPHVLGDTIRLALQGIAVATTARQFEQQPLARRHGVLVLALEALAGHQAEAAGRARLAAVAAARREQ